MARGIAPGIASRGREPRPFAFQQWPGHRPADWAAIVEAARADVGAVHAPIVAADLDAGAITAARANAERAGVADDIDFRRGPLEELEPPEGRGALVTNPPYGVRVGDPRALRELYAGIGRIAVTRLAGWDVTLLAADDALVRATGLPLRPVVTTRNGGIPVRVLTTTPAHSKDGAGYQPETPMEVAE
jgi:putative N6-adenine-specific DNA methylase